MPVDDPKTYILAIYDVSSKTENTIDSVVGKAGTIKFEKQDGSEFQLGFRCSSEEDFDVMDESAFEAADQLADAIRNGEIDMECISPDSACVLHKFMGIFS